MGSDGKRGAKARMQCKACKEGDCPLGVAVRASLPGSNKDPAICLACGTTYKPTYAEKQFWFQTPEGQKFKKKSKEGRAKAQPKASPRNSEEVTKRLKEMQKKLGASEAECKRLKLGGEAEPTMVVVDDNESAKVKELVATLRDLQKVPEVARKRLQGYEAEVNKVQDELNRARASIRDAQPLDKQKIAIDGRCKTLAKQHEVANGKLEELQEQQAALATKIAEKKLEVDSVAEKLACAKQERAAIAEKMAASHKQEAGGQGNADTVRATSEITARAVTSYFEGLPPEITRSPEGMQKMQMVKDWLHEIDTAAIRITAVKGAEEGSSDTSEVFVPMDEEELIGQLAEAATPPAGDGEGALEIRAKALEETKANIRKKNLLAGKAVRRTISK